MTGPDCVPIRYGEIGTKSGGVRGRMEGMLRTNVAAALEDREVPGVVSASPSVRVSTDTDAIYQALASPRGDVETFASRSTRRVRSG